MDRGSKIIQEALEKISRPPFSLLTNPNWCDNRATGFTTMKTGKFVAFLIGGSIILLEIAHQEGLIKINLQKLHNRVDSISKKVESSLVENEGTWIEKTEKYLDSKLDSADSLLKGSNRKMKKWYTRFIGDNDGPKINDLHIFLVAFVGGVALGIGTS